MTLRGLLLTGMLGAGTSWAAEAPPAADVAQVDELFKLVRRDSPRVPLDEAELEQALARALGHTCEATAREVGLGTLDAEALAGLHARIREEAEARVAALPPPGAPGRAEALRAAAREMTARPLAMEFLSRWLGLPPLAEPLCQPGRDAGGLGARERARLLASQLRTRKTAGALSAVPAATEVAAELGGNCAGAGLLEAGEWVQLAVAVENRSDRPWLSATAFPEAEGGCVWVDAQEPVAVGELAPRQRAQVPVWVYLARACPAPMERTLRLHLRDLRRPDVAVAQVQVELQPLAMGVPRVARERLDVDEPGDGSGAGVLRPGLRFEYIVDLVMADTDVHGLKMAYGVAPDARALLDDFSFREGLKMERGPEGVFRAADDLDGRVASEPAFHEVLEGAQGARRWLVTGGQGQLWLALDVDVELRPSALLPASQAPAPVRAAPLATRAVRGGSRPRASEVAPAVSATESLPASQVLNLVRKYLSSAPRSAGGRKAAAAEASRGAELVAFDLDGFRAEYEALYGSRASAPSPAAPAAPALLTYRVRLFRALPVLAVPSAESVPAPKVAVASSSTPAPKVAVASSSTPAPEVAPAPSSAPAPKVAAAPSSAPAPKVAAAPSSAPAPKVVAAPSSAPAPKVVAAPSSAQTATASLIRIDAGGGLLAYGVAAPSGLPSYWGGLTALGALEGRLRASVGRNIVAMLGVAYGAGNARMQGRPQAPGGFQEGTVEAGIGYLFAPASFELMPYAFVDGRMRVLAGTSEPARTFNAGVGGTARFFVLPQLGLFLDAAYRLGPPTHNVQGVNMISGGGPRLGTGVSVRF